MTGLQLRQYAIAFLASVGIIATSVGLYRGFVNPGDTAPPSIEVDGQTIDFTWTDDNTDEDLLIFTDKQTYSNSLSGAMVYAAVVNVSGTNQRIELQGYFKDTKTRIKRVSMLTEAGAVKNTYERQCRFIDEVSTSTGETIQVERCANVIVATSTVISNQWVPLPLKDRDTLEILKEAEWLANKNVTRKQVENFIANQKTLDFPIKHREVLYYRLELEYPLEDSGNFYLEAVGDDGAYGHLDPWYDSNWTYRIPIEVNASNVAGSSNHTNFPVYVDLADLPAAFHTNVKTDGCDIRVVESDETTETAFELVSYDSGSDAGELHFLADSLSYTATTTFYIYYGNSGASCYAASATYGRNNTWPAYTAVWHGDDDTTSTITDVTGNGNDGTKGAANQPLETASGQVEEAQDFSGGNYSVSIADPTDYEADTAGTISAYLKYAHSGALRSVVGYGNSADDNRFFMLAISTAEKPIMQVRIDLGSGQQVIATPSLTAPAANTWTHIAYVSDGTNPYEYYQNGTNDGSLSISANGGSTDHTWFGDVVGTLDNPSLGSLQRTSDILYFNGLMDEVRIASDAKSADWIATEYNNLSSPSTFYWVGTQETEPASGGFVTVKDHFWFFMGQETGPTVATGGAFSPDDVTGLVLWFDASDATTITETSGLVSQWDDKSSSGNDATQTVGASQPLTDSTTRNGLNTLYIEDDYFDLTSNLSTGDFTLFVVDIQTTDRASLGITAAQTRTTYISSSVVTEFIPSGLDGNGGTDIIVGGTFTDWHLNGGTAETIVTRDNVFDAMVNDTFQIRTIRGNLTGTDFDQMFTGQFNRKYKGEVAEVLLYSSELGSTDYNDVGQYLADKWGLTWTDI